MTVLSQPHTLTGAGHLNLYGAYEVLTGKPPRVTVFPAHWDLALEACPYMWPFCTQVASRPYL